MPRSSEEEAWRARRYGRRRRVLAATRSDARLSEVVDALVAELRRSRVPKDERERLLADLAARRDVTRRRAAIWAIVDALEAADPRPAT